MNKWLLAVLLVGSCTVYVPKDPGTFGYDLDFLRRHDSGLIVLGHGDVQLLVSPKYQGKVFTSTDSSISGPSFGWIHYKAFDGPLDAHMNAYGGEDRLWLGPEGGRFSLFFPPGAKMEFANWKTPAAFDSEPWDVVAHSDSTVQLRKKMQLVNYTGTVLSITINRLVSLMGRSSIDRLFGMTGDTGVTVVGYKTFTTLKNTGTTAWTDSTGMPCIWQLDMLNPSPNATVVIPFSSAPGDSTKPATTDYFGEIPTDRIKIVDSVIYFKADGRSRGKLGIHPARAKSVAGSYDPERHLLTIIAFAHDPKSRYLNQEWNTVKPPFSGDAMNAYDDGPLEDGSQMGPFYELESVSPAALLAPGLGLVHEHGVFHFTGSEAGLDKVSRKVLGVSIAQIKQAFQ